MANEQSGAPLRRWRPFYGAFGAIDEAIEEAGHPRAAFEDVRVRIVKLLRAATDDGVAEQLCAALDDAMAEALKTLRVTPVPHRALASTDLVKLVGALRNHSSVRICALAVDVLRGWSVGIHKPVKEKLDKLSGDRIPHQSTSTVIADGNTCGSVVLALATAVHVHKKELPAAISAAEAHKKKLHIPPVKMLATVPVAEANKKKVHVPPAKILQTTAPVLKPSTSETKKAAIDESKRMEATKRKLQEGYNEAKRIKLQHTIQKIDDKVAAKTFEQKQRKMTCRSRISTGVRRSLLPSLQMI